MSRFLQLWRTTTVRLTALFIALFIVFSVALLGYIAFQTSYSIQQLQVRAIERELRQLQMVNETRGIRALAVTLQQLATRPGPGIYYLADPSGQKILGNIDSVPLEVVETAGVNSFTYARNTDFSNRGPGDEADPEGGFALVQTVILDGGFRLVVGRDIAERRGFTAIIFGALAFGVVGIVILSAVAGGITANRVLRRIDAITDTSEKIMSGNLSERVPVTNRNDEFDALAHNLNRMLARIEQLMQGLKEVTDNVAHDLKTPLTRMRNRAETALRGDLDPQKQRHALEDTISEADQLIRTFNALLLIARVEAGTPSGTLQDVDLGEIARDVAELYEPVADEKGVVLTAEAADQLLVRANKELVVQALVNLVENALKYATPDDGGARVSLSARREGTSLLLEVCDNGPGIPQQERERVVERFVRLEKSRTDDGSGLGLSLVSAVARLHAGTLELLDNGPGLCARLSFPIGDDKKRGQHGGKLDGSSPHRR